MIDNLSVRFEERYDEIDEYLRFLEGIEATIMSGVPRLGGPDGFVITARQQRILNSGVYLQLYNLVESTITGCLDAVSKAAVQDARWKPGDLTQEMRREWVKHMARTSVDMGADRRLEEAITMCDHLVASLPVSPFDIDKGGGGNWHDGTIDKVASRIGCRIEVSRIVYNDVRRPIRNDLGAMKLIVDLRNKLAHGNLSFAECGAFDTARELRDLAERVAAYLREVVTAFVTFIREHGYLRPESRPAPATANDGV